MEKKNQSRVAGLSDHITSTISVTLVLFILGLVAGINITFRGLDRSVREKMGFTVIMCDSVSPAVIDSLTAECSKASYISQFKYLSADEVMAEETHGDGAELVELLGVNPYAPMFEIRLSEQYANVDSINRIVAVWSAEPSVDDVSVNTEMVSNLTHNARLLNMVLLVIAAALLLISFVLINNTVRLTVYARRFLIHTMKLVGAKGSFIRRPFIVVNVVQGIVAGILASALLASLVGWAKSWDGGFSGFSGLLPWSSMMIVFAAITVIGIGICALAALFATNRYLRADYDDMFS